MGPGSASFPFMDLASGQRWTLRANDGPIPFWMLSRARRVPDTQLGEYLELAKLLRAGRKARIGETLACKGTLWERLIEPFLVSALNIEAKDGSAALAGQVVRETLAAGGRNYHPLVARDGLSHALVRPALAYLEERGASVGFGRRLRGFVFEGERVGGLDFGDERVTLAPDDAIVLATPPQVAGPLLPGLSVPTEFRAIVNAHYRVAPPAGLPPITGLVGGLAQWVFAFPERLSVTISAGDAHADTPREELAQRIWADVAKVAGLKGEPPRWQIVRERRATFAASPAQDALRPGTKTKLAQSRPGGGLDADEAARHHRGRDPLRRGGGQGAGLTREGDMARVEQKRATFRALHAQGCFVLPNPWDVGSARLLQHLGFKALASTSSGFAWTQGRPDEGVTREVVLAHLQPLCEGVDLPINADFESGHAASAEGVAESVRLALAAGVAGLSIEDRDREGGGALYARDVALERLARRARRHGGLRRDPGGAHRNPARRSRAGDESHRQPRRLRVGGRGLPLCAGRAQSRGHRRDGARSRAQAAQRAGDGPRDDARAICRSRRAARQRRRRAGAGRLGRGDGGGGGAGAGRVRGARRWRLGSGAERHIRG